jgi:hypothetical protein
MSEIVNRPEDADWYDWDKFLTFCQDNGVSTDYWEDMEFAWITWKAGYSAAMNNI